MADVEHAGVVVRGVDPGDVVGKLGIILRESLFEKTPMPQLLADWDRNGAEGKISNQLSLFE